jgi:hypothetical protein
MSQAEWSATYSAVISETDPVNACLRIREAEQLLYSLFHDIVNLAEDTVSTAEMEFLLRALSKLRYLETTYLYDR